jgi:hypothetical protein
VRLRREDLRREAEESPLLEAFTREGLVKTQKAGKNLACAVVIFTVCCGVVIACNHSRECTSGQ